MSSLDDLFSHYEYFHPHALEKGAAGDVRKGLYRNSYYNPEQGEYLISFHAFGRLYTLILKQKRDVFVGNQPMIRIFGSKGEDSKEEEHRGGEEEDSFYYYDYYDNENHKGLVVEGHVKDEEGSYVFGNLIMLKRQRGGEEEKRAKGDLDLFTFTGYFHLGEKKSAHWEENFFVIDSAKKYNQNNSGKKGKDEKEETEDSYIIYRKSDVLHREASVNDNEAHRHLGVEKYEYCPSETHKEDTEEESSEDVSKRGERRRKTRRSTMNHYKRRNAKLPDTCQVVLIVDHLFYHHYAEADPAKTTSIVTQLVNEAGMRLQSANFEGFEQIRIAIKEIIIFKSATTPGNFVSQEENDPMKLLDLLSKRDWSDTCLAHLLTYRDFPKSVMGIAWIGVPQNKFAGICARREKFKNEEGFRSKNVGLTTFQNFGIAQSMVTNSLTFSHEIGHNFGSPHDNDPSCEPEMVAENGKGHWLMYEKSVEGSGENNFFFSACSKQNIFENLKFNSDCFIHSAKSTCGNKVIEGDEECDCGSAEECEKIDHCCNPQSCKLKFPAQCSPMKSSCCTDECKFKPATESCRRKTECSEEALCTGSTGDCPLSTPVANGTMCRGGVALCEMGTCTGSPCSLWGYTPCACKEELYSCQLCCFHPEQGCLPSAELRNYNPKAYELHLPAGVHCDNGSGRCNHDGKCEEIMEQPPTGAGLEKENDLTWLWVSIAAIVAVVLLGILIFWYCCRKKRGNGHQYEKDQLTLGGEKRGKISGAGKRSRKNSHHGNSSRKSSVQMVFDQARRGSAPRKNSDLMTEDLVVNDPHLNDMISISSKSTSMSSLCPYPEVEYPQPAQVLSTRRKSTPVTHGTNTNDFATQTPTHRPKPMPVRNIPQAYGILPGRYEAFPLDYSNGYPPPPQNYYHPPYQGMYDARYNASPGNVQPSEFNGAMPPPLPPQPHMRPVQPGTDISRPHDYRQDVNHTPPPVFEGMRQSPPRRQNTRDQYLFYDNVH
eukprot:Nk52_evm22s62 gene=Nk52_evmTU22s62